MSRFFNIKKLVVSDSSYSSLISGLQNKSTSSNILAGGTPILIRFCIFSFWLRPVSQAWEISMRTSNINVFFFFEDVDFGDNYSMGLMDSEHILFEYESAIYLLDHDLLRSFSA